jgi:hypothetical protein
MPPYSRTLSYYYTDVGNVYRIALKKSVGKLVFGRRARGGR